jgi:hypothetical protein
MQPVPATGPKIDIVKYIKGMYRILDLISEQGSGGLGTSSQFSLWAEQFKNEVV